MLEPAQDGLRPGFRVEDMLASVRDMETVDRWKQWLAVRSPALLVAGSRGLARRAEMQRVAASMKTDYVEVEGAN